MTAATTLSFSATNLHGEPALIRSLLLDLLAAFAAGELRPLPRRTFPLATAANAFRFMAQARHIGKLVLTMPGAEVLVPKGELPASATYLVTGGLGGIGQELARGLVAWGARNLILLSRQGEQAAGARQLRARTAGGRRPGLDRGRRRQRPAPTGCAARTPSPPSGRRCAASSTPPACLTTAACCSRAGRACAVCWRPRFLGRGTCTC